MDKGELRSPLRIPGAPQARASLAALCQAKATAAGGFQTASYLDFIQRRWQRLIFLRSVDGVETPTTEEDAMSRLPKDIISVLSHVAPIFSARVWPQAQTLLLGALLAPGKRTVSAVLEVMGLGAQPQFQTYHRLLNRCVWSPVVGSQRLLAL